MTFDFLYNKDNRVAFPWSEAFAEAHKEFVAITRAEARMLDRGMSIDEVVAERNVEKPTVSIVESVEPPKVEEVVEPPKEIIENGLNSEVSKEQTEQLKTVARDPAKELFGKGVAVAPENYEKIRRNGGPVLAEVNERMFKDAPVDKMDDAGNTPEDFTKYRRYTTIYPMEKFDKLPDTELVRFAREALGRDNYEDFKEGDEDQRDEHYKKLRAAIRKNLDKDIRKKLRRLALQGGNA